MNEKVMIATVYSYEPIIVGVLKLGASILHLIKDKSPTNQQEQAIREIKDKLSQAVKIYEISTETYDIYNNCKSCVELIDKIPKKFDIILNVSGARKTK